MDFVRHQEGGLTKEWITLFTEQIFNPENGLFESLICGEDVFMIPSRNAVLIPNF